MSFRVLKRRDGQLKESLIPKKQLYEKEPSTYVIPLTYKKFFKNFKPGRWMCPIYNDDSCKKREIAISHIFHFHHSSEIDLKFTSVMYQNKQTSTKVRQNVNVLVHYSTMPNMYLQMSVCLPSMSQTGSLRRAEKTFIYSSFVIFYLSTNVHPKIPCAYFLYSANKL